MRLVTRCVRRLTPRATPRGALRAVASVVGFVHLQRRSLTVCLPVAFPACSPQVTMVKQKIHTARNQTVKAHRNGIKKPKRQRYRSTKGVRLCDVMPWRCCGCGRALVAYMCRAVLLGLARRSQHLTFPVLRGACFLCCCCGHCRWTRASSATPSTPRSTTRRPPRPLPPHEELLSRVGGGCQLTRPVVDMFVWCDVQCVVRARCSDRQCRGACDAAGVVGESASGTKGGASWLESLCLLANARTRLGCVLVM